MCGCDSKGGLKRVSDNKELIEAVLAAVRQKEGGFELSCAEAFKLADKFGAEIAEIGRICNQRKVKIRRCQLGCFK